MSRIKLPEHRISLALFALFFSHVATATLLHHKTKIAQRYATPALTNIGERGLNVDTSSDIPIFRTFILKREHVIKLVFESEKWYLNEVYHANPLNPKGSVALVLGWIEGYDTPAINGNHWRHHFSNPFPNTKIKFEEAWENLGLD